jgi:hypothetical protein
MGNRNNLDVWQAIVRLFTSTNMVRKTVSPWAAMLAVTTLRRSGSSAWQILPTAYLPLLEQRLTTATLSPACEICTCM